MLRVERYDKLNTRPGLPVAATAVVVVVVVVGALLVGEVGRNVLKRVFRVHVGFHKHHVVVLVLLLGVGVTGWRPARRRRCRGGR